MSLNVCVDYLCLPVTTVQANEKEKNNYFNFTKRKKETLEIRTRESALKYNNELLVNSVNMEEEEEE